MRRPLPTLMLLASALLSLAAPAAAQGNKAAAELFVREAGGLFQAAIEIEIDDAWHLYHDDLGPEDAVGRPTTVTFGGAEVEWSEVLFPEPHVFDQEFGMNGEPTWINGHEGFITLYAQGRPGDGATPAAVTATISGLTCTEETCLPYREELTARTSGSGSLWDGFPAEAFGAASAGGVADPVSPAVTPAGGSSAPAEPKQDDHVDAELYLREVDGLVQAAIELDIEKPWHLYHDDLGPEDAAGSPTVVTLEGGNVEWSEVLFPEPVVYEQEFGMDGAPTWINGHEGFVTLYAQGRARGAVDLASVRASIEGQVCTEELCVPYGAVLASAGAGSDSLWSAFPAADAFAGGSSAASSAASGGARAPVTRSGGAGGDSNESLWAFLGLAVFWGLFTLLMPCTYPMIPITISFFTKQAEENPSKQILLSMTYGLGIVAIFILIGLIFGSAIVPFATHPVTNIIIGVLFLFFALSLFGMVNLQPPRFLLNAAGKASMRGGIVGVFLMGATLVITSFTCTAPFVGTLLAAGAAGGWVRIVLGMGVFGLTMAVPFVLLSMVPRKVASMPKAGEWMHTLKVFMGFVELAAAMKFISNADLVWGWSLLTRELFLVLWMVIFVVAAVFLFGMIHMKNESHDGIGPGRLVAATVVALFAGYCGYGLNNDMDSIMTAIIPPYSHPRGAAVAGGDGVATRRDHTIVKDDYDAARALAVSEGKALLVNFTGFT